MNREDPTYYQRVKLEIAYDGSHFEGWQSQVRGNTIQDQLQNAIAKLNPYPTQQSKKVVLYAAGRTDAGVHAFCQVAHMDIERSRWEAMNSAQWLKAINAHLPAAIRVLHLEEVEADFHARFSAVGKIYRYRIWNAPFLHPLERGRVWHLPQKLDPERLQSALNLFVGKHDFAAFAANRGKGVSYREINTVRTIFKITLSKREEGTLYEIDVEGEGFLYKMIRLLVGAAARCALDRAPLSWISELLDFPSKKSAFVAPAEGLYLVKVLY